MNNPTGTWNSSVSRRRFLLSTSLAPAALGILPAADVRIFAGEGASRTEAPGKLCLWYDRPAVTWMTEALPIGNVPMGTMLFGGTEIERIQFNEISLWSGDRVADPGRVLGESREEEEQNLGMYQAFGDIFIHLGHEFSLVIRIEDANDEIVPAPRFRRRPRRHAHEPGCAFQRAFRDFVVIQRHFFLPLLEFPLHGRAYCGS